jgi:hypothetical protein
VAVADVIAVIRSLSWLRAHSGIFMFVEFVERWPAAMHYLLAGEVRLKRLH